MLARVGKTPRLPARYPPNRSSKISVRSQKISEGSPDHLPDKRRGSAWEDGYQVDISTGFPVAIGYHRPSQQQHWLSWKDQRAKILAARRAEEEQQRADQSRALEDNVDQESEVWPVYRTSPYRAEAARQAKASTTTRILFVDEGQQCRAVLAAAIFEDLLKCYGRDLDICVESASVGPTSPGEHDGRVAAAARQARVTLRPRQARVFDEVVDIVNFDLVLVLDHFDLTEVVKEVAVLDNINPGGLYAARVKLLGRFGPKAAAFAGPPSLGVEDIPDPLYGNSGGLYELQRLRSTVQQIRAACRGLLQHLLDLHSRCKGGLPLSKALVQALQCPLLSASVSCAVAPRLHRRRAQRPVWREDGAAGPGSDDHSAAFYTIRTINGVQRVVRRPAKRGYWAKVENVEAELRRFMAASSIAGRMPLCAEMRSAGAHTLYSAIVKHGGIGAFAQRLGLDKTRRESGYWADFENVRREIMAIATSEADLHANGQEARQRSEDSAHDPWQDASLPESGYEDEEADEASGNGVARLPAMPSMQQLHRSGHNSLMNAINQWGGRQKVARRLGLPCPMSQQEQRLMTLGELSVELESAAPFVLQFGVMPSRTQLLEAARPDLVQAVKRMGGFKKVAAALDLAFLPARRGRSAARAWSPSDAHSQLALVAFGSSQHPVSISRAPLPGPPAVSSPSSGPHRRNEDSDGSAEEASPSGLERERRFARLAVEQRARSGSAADSLGAEVSTQSPPDSRGNPQQRPARRVASAKNGLHRDTESCHVPAGGIGREGVGQSVGGAAAMPIPMGRPPFAIGMRGAVAGLGILRQHENEQSEAGLVAPLLQEIAAEVQHFVSASGFSRMPTRLELKRAGRPDLANAIQRCGGFAAMARFLGLTFQETRGRKLKS